MRALDLVVVGGYLVSISVLGARMGRRQQSRDEYFLAGRQMPWMVVGVSIMATMLSTITYLSFPGEIFRFGFGYLATVLAYPLIYPIFAYGVLPHLLRQSATSAYEYLEGRYSPSVRTSVASIFLLTRLTWMAGIVYTACYALSQMTGSSIYVFLAVMGLVTTFYTSHGGIRGVIWTDVAQFALLIGGVLFIPFFVFARTGSGPSDWWNLFMRTDHPQLEIFSWDPTVRLTIVAAMVQRLFWTICTHSADQVIAQRYFATSSVKRARWSFLTYLVTSLASTLLLGACALALYGYYFHFSASEPFPQFQSRMALHADAMFPRFISTELPAGLSGMLIAAVLAAGMSSLSSGINSFSAVILVDFFGRWRKAFTPEWLTTGKSLSVLIGLAVTLAAAGYTTVAQSRNWNLLEANLRLGTVFTGPLAVPFLAGIMSRRPGPQAALFGLFGSAAIGGLLVFSKDLPLLEKEVSFIWVIPAATCAGLLLTFLASYLFRFSGPFPHPDQVSKHRGALK